MNRSLWAALAATIACALMPSLVQAQTAVPTVVSACGNVTFVPGLGGSPTVDVNGVLCTNSGGGGGAITVANGADVAQGNTADAAWTSGAGTVISLLKAIATSSTGAITSWAGGTLGAMSNYGTSPGAVLVPGVNNFTTGAVNMAATGTAVPGTVAAIGISDNGTSCSGGPCLVAAAALSPGTFGTPSTQVLSVQANDPCTYAAKKSVPIAISSATTTSLVALSGSTVVYVCGFTVTISQVVTTANTIKFEGGTGGTCATPTGDLTGPFGTGGVTAGIPITVSYGSGGYTVFASPASNAICAVTTIGGSGAFEGVLTYVQQ